MKNSILTNPALLLAVQAMVCACNSESETLSRIAEVEKMYQDSIVVLKDALKEQQKQIDLLSYPADQRFLKVKEQIDAGELDKASTGISELKKLFPNSQEADASSALIKQISELKEVKRKEEERLKALGFKALKIVRNATIDNNKISVSNCKIGLKFTHDVYQTYSGSAWMEHTADKGSSYISYNMDVTSSSKYPQIPTIAFYSIIGDKLSLETTFRVEFAQWSDYGCYLGNEPDHINDFAKVSTVKFRVGAQLENNYFQEPYVIVLKKANTLSRHYDKFENPPVSYSGDDEYPQSLTIEDFNNDQYVALKIANL